MCWPRLPTRTAAPVLFVDGRFITLLLINACEECHSQYCARRPQLVEMDHRALLSLLVRTRLSILEEPDTQATDYQGHQAS